MEHSSRRVVEVVNQAVEAQGLTLRTLSDATGIPLATLHRRLTGKVPFDLVELDAVALALGTTMAAITTAAEAA